MKEKPHRNDCGFLTCFFFLMLSESPCTGAD